MNFFTGKLEFKSRPLHFLTFFTGEKRYFLKKCPLLLFTGKKVQISSCLMDVRMIDYNAVISFSYVTNHFLRF